MTGQRSKFKMLDECVKGQVKFGDGSMVEIKGKGIVSLKCKMGEERELHEAMELMSANDMVRGFPKIVSSEMTCTGCSMSKQTRKPFPAKSKYSASKVLELIHGDICGPITPSTHAGNRYFMLLVDDYSRIMWVYLLKIKDEAFEAFKRFKAKVENEEKLQQEKLIVLGEKVHDETTQRENDGYESPAREERREEQDFEDENVDGSTEPKNYRIITDIYNTKPIELQEELLLTGVEEPEKNGTWELTEFPMGHKIIGLTWIFKLKRDVSGNIVKHKARIMVKGYTQEHGVDFDEIYAPVTRLETVRMLLALATKNSWKEVYVMQPEGFERKGQESKVYKLLKALYGLRQAPRAWYSKLNKFLERLGFQRCPYEHAVYTRKIEGNILVVGVYVDELLITGTSISIIKEFKQEMNKQFDMSDLDKLTYYLGTEIEQGSGFIKLK
ncbi:uncharacterized protein LOC141664984 [Apium graveolens]|uniref:uncharacterized protein LOC141664984 n=1 Tax=Apium graveolens TaxID=4045 RepID=UPI003D7A81E1